MIVVRHHTFTSANFAEHHFTTLETHTMSSQLPLASFLVEISLAKTILHLKDAIVAWMPNRFHGIDANELVLWKAERPDEDEAIKAFDINDATEMRSTYEIRECFTDPPKKHIHIVIKVPGK